MLHQARFYFFFQRIVFQSQKVKIIRIPDSFPSELGL